MNITYQFALTVALVILSPCYMPGDSTHAQNSEAIDFDPSKSDPQAIEIVKQMWQALGGIENWREVGYLSFHWLVEREAKDIADFRHDWDRFGNRYRVEGTNRDGQHFVVIFNTESRQGQTYLDGAQVEVDSTKRKLLDMAYGRFINDSYWLIMPYKLQDPGVVLSYEGEEDWNGKQFDVIKVTFEQVGLTPGDTYWAYIDKEDRLMKKWEYHLQGWEPERERGGSAWTQWQQFGDIKLALSRPFNSGSGRIYFKDVIVSDTVDDAIFANTSRSFEMSN